MTRRFNDLFPDPSGRIFILKWGGLWTLLIAIFLGMGFHYNTEEDRQIALNQARDSFQKDVT